MAIIFKNGITQDTETGKIYGVGDLTQQINPSLPVQPAQPAPQPIVQPTMQSNVRPVQTVQPEPQLAQPAYIANEVELQNARNSLATLGIPQQDWSKYISKDTNGRLFFTQPNQQPTLAPNAGEYIANEQALQDKRNQLSIKGVPQSEWSKYITKDASGRLFYKEPENAPTRQIEANNEAPEEPQEEETTLEEDIFGKTKKLLNKYGLSVPNSNQTPINAFSESYKKLYDNLGLTSVKKRIEEANKQIVDIDNEMADKINEVNENPWLAEGIRRNKIVKVQEKYQQRRDSAVNLLKLNQSLYDAGTEEARYISEQATSLSHNQEVLNQQMLFKAMDMVEKEQEATRKLSEFDPSTYKEINKGLYDLKSQKWIIPPASETEEIKKEKITINGVDYLTDEFGNISVPDVPEIPQQQSAETVANARVIERMVKDLESFDEKTIKSAVGPIDAKTPDWMHSASVVDLRNKYNSLVSSETLKNMGKIKGVLSDSDMKILRDASTQLKLTGSEEAYKKELRRIKYAVQAVIQNDVLKSQMQPKEIRVSKNWNDNNVGNESKWYVYRNKDGTIHIGEKGDGYEDFTSRSSFNQVGGDTNKAAMRTDRHNNPTAFTTDIAKLAGLKEGVDYVAGDSFANGQYRTARLLNDPIDTTIRVIDKIGFQTASGNPRWTYINMPKKQWDSLSYSQKKYVIAKMYKQEGGTKLTNFFA